MYSLQYVFLVAFTWSLKEHGSLPSLPQINLDPGLRQGQTKYNYIVMQFPRDDVMEAEPALDE